MITYVIFALHGGNFLKLHIINSLYLQLIDGTLLGDFLQADGVFFLKSRRVICLKLQMAT